ncbi:MAG: TIGR00341 family protein [Bacteroidales bacterium]|nr:TIGR00341 family protein [Bacteroidales bacterium]
MRFQLIYDPEQWDFIQEKLLPLVEGIIDDHAAYSLDELKTLKGETALLVYLSDGDLHEALPIVLENRLKLAVLPHPEAKEACIGLGVSRQLEKAVDHLKKLEEPVLTDVLYCNDQVVFNQVSVGETFMTNSHSGAFNFFKAGSFKSLKRLVKTRFFRVNISLPNDKIIKTAVAGITISEHRKSSLLSRLVLEESSINDGLLHALLISPRSISQMLRFLFGFWKNGKRLPDFAAHLKVSSLLLEFPEGEKIFVHDAKVRKADKLEFGMGEQQLQLYPGALLELPESTDKPGELIKTSALAGEQTARELTGRTIPLIRQASTDEFKELFQLLRDNAKLKSSYLVLMVLSTMLATFGLFANSSPVVIGAMILAPLMSPIISLSMGALRQDKSLIIQSAKTILTGMGIAMLFAVILTWVTPIQAAGHEILSRTRPNLLDLGVAVISGIAGAYAHAREEVAKTLAGVAIAVALIPPLAVAAIGLAWLDWQIGLGALLLLVTNLAGIVLAGSFTFMLLGFSPFKLATRGMLISLLVVLLLSIPLALSFGQMVQVHRFTRDMEKMEYKGLYIKDVQVQTLNPLRIGLKLVTEEPLSTDQLDSFKLEVEKHLERDVELEVVLALERK